ncbi:unnamed protein product [Blepharisma stoltei]|uniref:Uncharacterized protein n=1 Tax=Blepharisma stoltei TaxID=1481888 RepID=A0AAU9J5X6_9CILI|nr:unnamed protein product [Blepharisma stoltei]
MVYALARVASHWIRTITVSQLAIIFALLALLLMGKTALHVSQMQSYLELLALAHRILHMTQLQKAVSVTLDTHCQIANVWSAKSI